MAVLALAGFGAYHFYPKSTGSDPAANATVNMHSARSTPTTKASTTCKPAAQKKPTVPEAVIRLTAAQDCWVGLDSPPGRRSTRG